MYCFFPVGHEDYMPLTILESILSNGETGLMDKLVLDGKIMDAMLWTYSFKEHGAIALIYIPKLIGQSHEKAETYIFACLDSIKQGRFSDDLFEAVKMSTLSDRLRSNESLDKLASLLLDLEMSGQTYDDYLQETEKIRNLTKEEIVAIANKYFGDNYIDFRSKMGFPKKEKIEKPDWKPIEAKNTEEKSDFAKAIETQQVPETEPQIIKFNEDVLINKVNNSFTLYSAKNPRNDIFEMKIWFNYGSMDNPDLERAINYLELLGTQSKSFDEFNLELQKLGASIYFSNPSGNYTTLTIRGFEKDLNTILALCYDKLYHPANNEDKIEIIVENEKYDIKFMKHDAATWGIAVYNYTLYGNQSYYRRRTPLKEWKKRSGEELLKEFSKVLDYNGYILFTGNTDPKILIDMINSNKLVKENAVKGSREVRIEKKFTESQVFAAHNKKFLQSNIHFFVGGEKLNKRDKAVSSVFNKYFGTDMYSIVFQEIREFRSLGYAAYGYYTYDNLDRKPGGLICFLGTQSDKTIDGTYALKELITDMPKRLEKFNASKEALIMSRASNYYTFRSLPSAVFNWIDEGYDHDPRLEITDIIKKTEYEDVYDFYQRMVKDRPVIIMMSGNMNRVNKKDLDKFGKITTFKYKDLFND